ncbi:S-layer homology domain-containing protein [Paenibacillus sp. LHD-117]
MRGAVARVVEASIMKGDKESNFSPRDNATRAEAAVVIERLLRHLKFIN